MEEEFSMPDGSTFKLDEDVKKVANILFAESRVESVRIFKLIQGWL